MFLSLALIPYSLYMRTLVDIAPTNLGKPTDHDSYHPVAGRLFTSGNEGNQTLRLLSGLNQSPRFVDRGWDEKNFNTIGIGVPLDICS